MKKISLHEPYLNNSDQRLLNKAFKSTWISGAGKYVNTLEKKIKDYTKTENAVICNSGSSGLFISLNTLGIKKFDEVIVPTITFVATINSVVQNKASPIFMDCDDQFNIDIKKTIMFLNRETYSKKGYTYNKKTKKKIFALVVVHCFGFPVQMDELFEICKKKKIFIIEDSAESLGSKYVKGKFKNFHTGTIGDLGVISFNGNKIITGGGGGVVISNNKKQIKKISYMINQAKDDTVKFIHNNSGYNFKSSNLQCALICSQLDRIDLIIKKKIKIHNLYKNLLDKKKFKIIEDNNYSNSNYWINVVTLKNFNGTHHNKLVNALLKRIWK